jgi:hypothetical protein
VYERAASHHTGQGTFWVTKHNVQPQWDIYSNRFQSRANKKWTWALWVDQTYEKSLILLPECGLAKQRGSLYLQAIQQSAKVRP